jgi:hypothetical protein
MADLPRIVMRRLHDKSRAVGVHPDPNLISAFAENSLPGEARAEMMRHLAQCANCREIVFLFNPDQAATLPAAMAVPSRWLTWPMLRWGAAVAAVVVVVAAVSLHRPSGGNSASSGAIQQTDAPIVQEKVAVGSLPEEKQKMAELMAPAAVTNGAVTDSEAKPSDQFKKQGSTVAASAMRVQSQPLGDKVADRSRDDLDKTQTVEVTAGQVQWQADNAQGASGPLVPGRAKNAASEPVSGMGGGISAGVAPVTIAASQPHRAVSLPTAAPRWTLTSDGTLQRSIDFGRTWQTVQVAPQASFRALAASGKDIWVGGSKGALYHSTDAGQNWTQVQPVAAGQALADDIIGVEFPDVLHGKLTTSSKETWITADSGQSWDKQ